MTDDLVARLNRLIVRGGILYVDGVDLRIPDTGEEWQGCADQFAEEVKAWVKEQSPADAVRLEMLSPYPAAAPVPPGNPWWKPAPLLDSISSCTSSVKCETNNPLSYHLALVKRLEKIANDWRVKLPEKVPEQFTFSEDVEKGYSEHVKSTRGVKGQAPTEAEDVVWGKGHQLGRARVMELRRNSPDRTDKDRRTPNPAKK